MADIAEKYVEVFGTPEQGERHNYYNTMVKNFRLICNNDPKILHAILPRFGNSKEETLKQCQGICRSNMVTRLPREFYLFLRQNGFYPLKGDTILTKPQDNEQDEEEEEETPMPILPPIFREFCSVCPQDFVLPTIDALLPIIGTLTSYLRADYYDGMEQSTSFYTVLYAPPSSSKSFVKRLMDPLFHLIYARDEIASLRENIYIDEVNAKGANDKSPDDPHVSVRIMPVINSQAEFLTKMKDNKGYHMFTFAEEVDSFVKGTKAAGGDKSDLLRIAWDNGKYGQAFKGKGTFKGTISLYYNVLMTGTPAQVLRCYKDVENGMATRVTICEIENQVFASFPVWKKMSKRQNAIIETFVKKCDERTYKEPLEFDINEASFLESDAFKTDVPWHYEFRMHQFIDMSWLKTTIAKWLEKERINALQSVDFARDTWRKRTAVMGFRLGMICTQLWQDFTPKEQKIAKDFIVWWMDREMENAMKFFAPAFNSLMNNEDGKKIRNENLFKQLPEEFEISSLIAWASKNGLKHNYAYTIVNRWQKAGLIEKVVKDETRIWRKLRQ